MRSVPSNQMRWVILLLASAVILPTVCLLWFLNQTIKNERLAVRSRLLDLYTTKAEGLMCSRVDNYFENFIRHWQSMPDAEPWTVFHTFAAKPDFLLQGMVIYDSNGALEFPVSDLLADESFKKLVDPFQIEQAGDYEEAVNQYRKIADEAGQTAVGLRAELSVARCMEKLGRTQEAVELARKLSDPVNRRIVDPQITVVRAHASIYLAGLYRGTQDPQLLDYLRTMLADSRPTSLPVETMAWQLSKLIDMARQEALADKLGKQIKDAESRVRAYQNAVFAASLYPDSRSLDSWPDQTIRRIAPESDLYGIKFMRDGRTILGISSAQEMLEILRQAIRDMEEDAIIVQVLDETGQPLLGRKETARTPFWTSPPGKFFPDFSASVYFTGNSIFQAAARRNAALYVWAAVLVITFLLFSGAFAARTVGRQMRLNRLKNDFIATVTHELKTPLSSTRLLVDTLLENDCRDDKQTREYLELIAKENHRLSRLIDNFLTFSRMERNKQAFEFVSADPAEIARTAADAVRTKFESAHCQLALDIPDNLPQIRADKDAMTTVLVNLLDNACKYTGDKKEIALRVFTEDDRLCFAVQDNGIGISRREKKKIFERFYQADRSLTRKTEGTGLGLSIVKFIVDAHRGRIEVDSKPGAGSTFTVKIPSGQGGV